MPSYRSDPDTPVITWARRTPIGTAGHALAGLTAADLAAPLLAEGADHLARCDEVILGNCLGPGGNVARVAALAAGLGHHVPAVTVDRQCGSGLEAVLQAGARVRAGDVRAVLAGGTESASTAPWRFWPPHAGPPALHAGDPRGCHAHRPDTDPSRPPGGHLRRYVRAPFTPAGVPDPDMGPAADALAAALGITREDQDAYALRSHSRAAAAAGGGGFTEEILPIAGIAADEHVRPGMTLARLARLRPAFGPDGTATAGNSCPNSDGAALVAVGRDADAPGVSLRIVAAAVAGCDPALPGLGAAAAIRTLMGREAVRGIGLTVADVGAVEITEAFASVALATIDEVGLQMDTVCPDGGAIALGHPWGASGAVLLVRLVRRMLRADTTEFGLAACAIGGGQGIAMLLQRSEP